MSADADAAATAAAVRAEDVPECVSLAVNSCDYTPDFCMPSGPRTLFGAGLCAVVQSAVENCART